MLSGFYKYFFSSTSQGTLTAKFPAATFPENNSGPTLTLPLELDFFEKNLKCAARYAKATWNVGNGIYNKNDSVIAPILNDLTTHPHLTIKQAKNIQLRLNGLSDDTKKKYYAPLRNLSTKLDEAIRRLEGVKSDESRANREAFRDFMQHLTVKQQSMTTQEQLAILQYKTPVGYSSVNAALRGQSELSLDNLNYAKAISNGMTKSPSYKNTVYRGAGCLPGGVESAQIGQVYTEEAFVSTAATLNAAFKGKFSIAITPKDSFFDISTIENSDDLNASNIAYFEQEVLGLPGTKLRYLGEKDGLHHYEEV